MSTQEKYDETIFPARLRSLFDDTGITITALARELGISRQAVSQYADGTALPNIDKLKRIADYFYVSADWLIGLANDSSRKEDIKKIGNSTGLTKEAVEAIQNLGILQTTTLSLIVTHPEFSTYLSYIQECATNIAACKKLESQIDPTSKLCSPEEFALKTVAIPKEEFSEFRLERIYNRIQQSVVATLLNNAPTSATSNEELEYLRQSIQTYCESVVSEAISEALQKYNHQGEGNTNAVNPSETN